MNKFSKFKFLLNGCCEHCGVIPGPCYYGSFEDDNYCSQYCIDCLFANGLDSKVYVKYLEIVKKLDVKYKKQMKEIVEMEKKLKKGIKKGVKYGNS